MLQVARGHRDGDFVLPLQEWIAAGIRPIRHHVHVPSRERRLLAITLK
jgi:hypothetical protein